MRKIDSYVHREAELQTHLLLRNIKFSCLVTVICGPTWLLLRRLALTLLCKNVPLSNYKDRNYMASKADTKPIIFCTTVRYYTISLPFLENQQSLSNLASNYAAMWNVLERLKDFRGRPT